MSDGGLLEKVAEQQDQVIVAEEAGSTAIETGSAGLAKITTTLLLFGLVPILFVMWFGVYLDFIPFLLPGVVVASFGAIWWRLEIGLPDFASGDGVNPILAGVVSSSFLVMLLIPAILSVVLEGDLSMGEVEFSEDGEQITVKLRQNTLTSKDINATIVIEQGGSVVWTGAESLSIDKSDGRGDYGSFTLVVEDFYADNALPSSPYTIIISCIWV